MWDFRSRGLGRGRNFGLNRGGGRLYGRSRLDFGRRRLHEEGQLHEGVFYVQPLVGTEPVAGFALTGHPEGVVQEAYAAAHCLAAVTGLQGIGLVEQGFESAGAGHQQVTQMSAEGADEVKGVETLSKYFVEKQQGLRIVACEECVHEAEVVFVIDDPEVADDVGVADVRTAEGDALVEEGEGVAHGSVGLLGYDMQAFVIDLYVFAPGYVPEVLHHVRDGDTVEIVCLAAGQDGGEYLVLLGGAEDEDGVCGGLFQGLEESVESLGAEHVHLVYDVNAVPADLGWYLHLFQQAADVIDAVVRCGIELVDAVGTALLEGEAGFAGTARFEVGPRVRAVYGFGEDARGAGLAHPARAAEQVCMGQLPSLYGVLEGPGYVVLPDEGFERVGTVLPGGYYIITHKPTNLIINS